MSRAYSYRDFFDQIPGQLDPLFDEREPVWKALDWLKAFIRDHISPNLPDGIKTGIPTENTIVLLPENHVREVFELVCDDGSKGRIQVKINGEAVPEATVICAGAVFMDLRVQIGAGVLIEPGSLIKGPVIIGDHTEVRQAAYIREDCVVGSRCVVGHATEVKHSIFMDGAKAGHFAYIGDSILGNDVNLGAGTKLANLKFGEGSVKISTPDRQYIDTGRRKIGAVLGDRVQTGCNSVANPGVFLGPDSLISPNATVKPGIYKAKTIIR